VDIGAAATDEERQATYRVLNSEIDARHDLLVDEARGLDTKATVVAGFAAASISFLLGTRRGLAWDVALIGDLGALALAIATLWPRRWAGIEPRRLSNELGNGAPAFVLGEIVGTKVGIYERNSRRAVAKVVLWTASVALLSVGTVVSIWSTIVEVPR
jgi:hypothetical protein